MDDRQQAAQREHALLCVKESGEKRAEGRGLYLIRSSLHKESISIMFA